MFYLAAYAAMIVRGVRRGDPGLGPRRAEPHPPRYAGLARRDPFLAAVLALFLLSLAGIPPTAGFIAKVAVFSAAVRRGEWPLVLIAVLTSVVAAFFYLRLIVLMYMQDPDHAPAEPVIERTRSPRLAVVVPAALTLLFGVLPGILFGFLDQASVVRL